jgi:2,4-dienoyl-CoA reductase-like NADH-dependent reductase (Old Yellow Enzyme family)
MAAHPVIEPLLAPFALRGMIVANRIAMAPMTRYFSPDGVPGDDVPGYYRRRAERGVGLVVTEGIGVAHPVSVDHPGVPVLHGDAPIAKWRAIVDGVHAAGAKILPQLWHQGAMWNVEYAGDPQGQEAVRPSGIWGPADGIISIAEAAREQAAGAETRPMSDEDIQDVIDGYAVSARNALAAGFDGIAIHAAHGYLIDTFFWHETNRRADRFGGDHKARATFGAEVVRTIRKVIGEDMPIVLRFSQFKMQDYRARLAETPDELAALLGPLADAGVDMFDGSQRYFDTPIFEDSPLNLAGWAKALTGKASMTVGGVGLGRAGGSAKHIDASQKAADNLPQLVARFEKGEFDMVAVGRSLLNDPAWLEKAIAGADFSPFDSANLERLT